MKTRLVITVLAFLSLVSVAMAKGPRERAIAKDPIPLHNWLVDFDKAPIALSTPSGIASNAVPSAPSHFITVVPCRVVDTRRADGPYGGPKLVAGTSRSFVIPAGPCAGIPPAAAYSLNLTVNQPEANDGFLIAYPTGSPKPLIASLNFNANETRGNAAIVAADGTGSIDIFSNVTTHVIIDINGYFAEAAAASSSPIRVTPNNMGIWHVIDDLCGTGSNATNEWTNGEATTPPLGTGSFKVTTASNAEGTALGTEAYSGTLVSDISVLRYSTKVVGGPDTDQPYIYLQLDDNGDGAQDRTIYFIPANNLAGEGGTKTDVWQTWDARRGMWNEGGDTGSAGAVPLSTFGSSHILGIRIASGCGPALSAPDDHFTDDFEIGIGGATPSVYDFERN